MNLVLQNPYHPFFSFIFRSPYLSLNKFVEWIDEVIDNQMIVSELEPGITGQELLAKLIDILGKFDDQKELIALFRSLSSLQLTKPALPWGHWPLFERTV